MVEDHHGGNVMAVTTNDEEGVEDLRRDRPVLFPRNCLLADRSHHTVGDFFLRFHYFLAAIFFSDKEERGS